MSIFISMIGPGEVCLLTDGQFSAQGKLAAVGRKVIAAKRVPAVMTGRGVYDHMRVIIDEILEKADEIGTAALVKRLPAFVRMLSRKHRRLFEGLLEDGSDPDCDFCLIGWIPGAGPFHRIFSTKSFGVFSREGTDTPGRRKYQPWEIHAPGDEPGMSFGDWPHPQQIEAAGIPLPRREDSLAGWLCEYGADIVEILRKRVDYYDNATGEPRYIIGGQLDLTVIDADGGSTRTLRTWPDEIGKPIDPFRPAA